MFIGIDGNEANVSNKVGVSEFAFELLQQFNNFKSRPSLEGISNKTSDIKFQIFLKNKPLNNLPKESEYWRYRIIGPKKLWTQFRLPLDLYIHKPRPDVFFSPTHYAPRFSPVPTVVSIMDLSYIHFPEMFKKSDLYQLKNWTHYSVNNAKKIITISKYSKDDIINYYKINDSKVKVIYPGIKRITNMKFEISNMKLLKDKYNISGDYVLFVGTLQPRKNIERLIEAFALTLKNAEQYAEKRGNKDLKLVVIGRKGWLYEEILKAPEKYGIRDKVKFLDFVADEDLPYFYKNAICFVLPSLYEGFGLPVLEAMKYGCPVLTSNVSSLPEAGGSAALYFDPQNVDDIAEKINMMIENKNLRENLRRRGFDQIKKFSWEKAARETLQVLEEVANKK